METLATIFPFLVVVAALALAFLAFRLNLRVSRGSQSAGPRDLVRPAPVGLQRTPWELKALDDQVRASTNHRARGDLVHTVNRLTRASGIDDPALILAPDADDATISAIVDHLERRLELPPLMPTPTTQRLGSADR
jgi:hypothetical protein